jgi:predicted nucleic acid-binding protein
MQDLPEPLRLQPGQEAPSTILSSSDEMRAERAAYLDPSALVRPAIREPESAALRLYVRQRRPLISSMLVRIEVSRVLLRFGPRALGRGRQVLATVDLVRLNDRILNTARTLLPGGLRSVDAIHLATALQLGDDLAEIVTYDERMAAGARDPGLSVVAPA